MSEDLDVTLELQDGYRFLVDFGDDRFPRLVMDEPTPLGEEAGPNAARVLAAAVGNCLSASALFCLHKAHVEVTALRTSVHVTQGRNEGGRLRITSIDVTLQLQVASADLPRIGRCLEIFEDFCVVTQSVRRGVDVRVVVQPSGTETSTLKPVAVAS